MLDSSNSMIPSQCKLWNDEEYGKRHLYDGMKLIERVEEEVFDYQVRECTACGQKYIFAVEETFAGYDDTPRYHTFIPVSDEELDAYKETKKTITTPLEFQNEVILVDIKQGGKEYRWRGKTKEP